MQRVEMNTEKSIDYCYRCIQLGKSRPTTTYAVQVFRDSLPHTVKLCKEHVQKVLGS